MLTTLSITSLSQGNLHPTQQIVRSSLEADLAQATAAAEQPTSETSGRVIGWVRKMAQVLGKSMPTNPSLTVSNQAH